MTLPFIQLRVGTLRNRFGFGNWLDVVEHRMTGVVTLGSVRNDGDGWRFHAEKGAVGDPFDTPFACVASVGQHVQGVYDELLNHGGVVFLYNAAGACTAIWGVGYTSTSHVVSYLTDPAGPARLTAPIPPGTVTWDIMRFTKYMVRQGQPIPGVYDRYP